MLSANFEYILLIYFIYTKGFGNMNGERITLQNIKGIGDKISEKILNSIGGEEELQKIVDNVDVEKISAIDGISQRKAIEIMNQLLNDFAAFSIKGHGQDQHTTGFCDECKRACLPTPNH